MVALIVFGFLLWLLCWILVKIGQGIQYISRKPVEPPPAFDVPVPRLWRLVRVEPDTEFALTSGVVCAETEDEARALLNAEETRRDPKLRDTWSNRGMSPSRPDVPLITVKVIGVPRKGMAAMVYHCV